MADETKPKYTKWSPSDFENLTRMMREGQPLDQIAAALGKSVGGILGAINKIASDCLEKHMTPEQIKADFGIPLDTIELVSAKLARKTNTGTRAKGRQASPPAGNYVSMRLDAIDAKLTQIMTALNIAQI